MDKEEALKDYQKVSGRFVEWYSAKYDEIESWEKQYTDYVKEMFVALTKAGYSAGEAKAKIREDHKGLRGFSRQTIDRHLPPEYKRKYTKSAKDESEQGEPEDSEEEQQAAAHEDIEQLKKRIEELEAENKRLREGLISDGEYILEVPRLGKRGSKNDILFQLTDVIAKMPEVFHVRVKNKQVVAAFL
jgi:hypothetical protein